MAYVVVGPERVGAAAGDLVRLGSVIDAVNAAARVSTTQLLAAGGDEVSAAIAALLGEHAREYQAVSAQASAFHDQFVQALTAGAGSYVQAESTNTGQALLDIINVQTQALLGRPLIGNGTNGAPGTGQAGGPGGILWGNGGNGGSGARPDKPAVPADRRDCSVMAELGGRRNGNYRHDRRRGSDRRYRRRWRCGRGRRSRRAVVRQWWDRRCRRGRGHWWGRGPGQHLRCDWCRR